MVDRRCLPPAYDGSVRNLALGAGVPKTRLHEYLIVAHRLLFSAEWNKGCAEARANFARMNAAVKEKGIGDARRAGYP
jgi:hypothetical protein